MTNFAQERRLTDCVRLTDQTDEGFALLEIQLLRVRRSSRHVLADRAGYTDLRKTEFAVDQPDQLFR
jgi:hypothetical protein